MGGGDDEVVYYDSVVVVDDFDDEELVDWDNKRGSRTVSRQLGKWKW